MLFDAAHAPTLSPVGDHGRVTVPESDSDRKAELREQIRARRRERDEPARADVAARLAVRLGLVPEVARLVADPASGVRGGVRLLRHRARHGRRCASCWRSRACGSCCP